MRRTLPQQHKSPIKPETISRSEREHTEELEQSVKLAEDSKHNAVVGNSGFRLRDVQEQLEQLKNTIIEQKGVQRKMAGE